MSQNEELAKQILTAYVNGQVDLANVPDLQKNWGKRRMVLGQQSKALTQSKVLN
ncbi:hypothetical protein ABMB44_15690 [Levilactobacillus brevis]